MSSNSTRATPQGGILDGANPSVYDPKNPIILFVIQVVIIVVFCRVLHYPLSMIRQPRVIAEVIAGIILGPSVFGQIPGFQNAIFPAASIPNLNLVATLGLVLFLFLVGVETDLRFLMSTWRIGVSVSAAGMLLPFALGSAISYGLYNQFRSDPGTVPVSFGTYLLFIGIAMAITAFPVLCRILTELKLLSTNVGVIVLSAGVGNDVTGWILLALCVALVNAGSGLTALWVLFVGFGYVLLLAYVVRPIFMRFLKRTGSLQRGPSQSVVAVTLLMALISAFFTQVIGIHAIFGGFMIGLICPHDGGFAIKLTEKIEDLVTTIFLPLYFALSGLQTDLGLLNTGIVWAYVIGIIAIAFVAKVTGGTLASKWTGLLWRESFTVGVLMSCKGLVELIVLNIGLQAKILSQRTFTMFVVMALVTTFVTTPLTSFLYPKSYQVKVARWRDGEIDWDENPVRRESGATLADEKLRTSSLRTVLVYLRLESLPNICSFVSLLGSSRSSIAPPPRIHNQNRPSSDLASAVVRSDPVSSFEVYGLRLKELTERLSSSMKVSEIEDYSFWDPVVNTFRAFSQLNHIPSQGRVAVVPEYSFADTIVEMAREVSADFLLLPWSDTGNVHEQDPFTDRMGDTPYPAFVSALLPRLPSGVGIFIDRAWAIPSARPRPPSMRRTISAMSVHSTRSARQRPVLPAACRNQHLFLPYFGGRDDRYALRLVLRLAQNSSVTVTVVHLDLPRVSASATSPEVNRTGSKEPEVSSAMSTPPVSLQEKEADTAFLATMRDSLPAELTSSVVFQTLPLDGGEQDPVQLAVRAAQDETHSTTEDVSYIVVVGRGSIGGDSADSLSDDGALDVQRAIGVIGEVMARRDNGVKASVLVVQAPPP
jgi:Kef-type K+ transport system membrane component KefB